MNQIIQYNKPIWKHGYGGRLNRLAVSEQQHSTGAYRIHFACGAFSDFASDQDFHKKHCAKCESAQQSVRELPAESNNSEGSAPAKSG